MARRLTTTPPPPYAAAIDALARMRQRYITRMLRVNFTAEEFLNCILAPEHIKTLRAAYPLLKPYDRSTIGGRLRVANHEEVEYILSCNQPPLEVAGCDSEILQEVPSHPGVWQAVKDVLSMEAQFAQCIRVINWLNGDGFKPGEVSAAAARYYWPPIVHLMPESSAVHTVGAGTFKEPRVSPDVALLRESSAFFASALLCPSVNDDLRSMGGLLCFKIGGKNSTIPVLE